MAKNGMHKANPDTSDRLKRLLYALYEAGLSGATTWELMEKARICSASTVVSELRASGYDIECRREGKGRFRYWLKSAPPQKPPIVIG